MSKEKNIQVLKPLFRTREVLEEIEDCLEKGWTGIGYKTEEFEEKWKVFTNFNNCHFLNSASSGLHLALNIYKDKLGWEDGDEIITTGLTFISTNHAILYENLYPVFADIDRSLCLNPDSVERLISKKTRALIYVGVGGNAGNFKSIVKLCKNHNLVLILDAAHMAGTKWKENNTHVGSEADCAVFSFQAVKNLPSGDAGAICFNDKELDQRARKLSWLGIDKSTYDRFTEGSYKWRYDVNDLGFNYHGNSVMAAICLVSLRYLDEDNQYRRDISDTYTYGLKHLSSINLIEHDQEISSSRHLYQISLDKRDDLMNFLYEKSIYCGVHYLNNQDYKIFRGFKNEVKMTKYYSDKLLSLPLHLNLNTEDIERIINSICSFYSND